jgi:ribosomal protein S18 acetylase RimI-like enzyme
MAVTLRAPHPAELAALADQLDLGGTVAMAYPAPDPARDLRVAEVAGQLAGGAVVQLVGSETVLASDGTEAFCRGHVPDALPLLEAAGFRPVRTGELRALDDPAAVPALCLLAFRDGEAVGFAFCLLERRAGQVEGWVHDLGVVPSARGVGLGRALLWQGILAMRERGAARVLLGVDAANHRARRLYHRTGFRTTQTIDYLRLPLARRAPA